MPPPATEGVSSADANLSPSTMTPGDPPAVSPSIRPVLGAIAWAIDGMDHAIASGDVAVAHGYDPSVLATATTTYVGGVMTGYIAPTMFGDTSAVSSPVCPTVGSGIMAITSCSTTSEGAP